jgi:hypothetical protein
MLFVNWIWIDPFMECCGRLGQVENARKHLCHPRLTPDPAEMQKLKMVEKHINKCADVRRVGDWKSVLRELDAAIAAGADSSPQVFLSFFIILLFCDDIGFEYVICDLCEMKCLNFVGN